MANLLDNAVHYGNGQPLDIEYEMSGDTVEIRIMDRGLGMPEDSRVAIFQSCRRLARCSSRTGG